MTSNIGVLELETIRRVGELIKGVGTQLIEYAAKKKEQLAQQAQKPQEHAGDIAVKGLTAPNAERVIVNHIRTAQLKNKL